MPPAPDGAAPLAAALAGLEHPGARRPLGVVPAAGLDPADGWLTLADWLEPAAAARRLAADPVAGLGIAELTGAMAFHALAVPLVDVAVGLLVGAGASIALDADRIWVRSDGPAAVAVALDPDLILNVPADLDRLAEEVVALLDPVVATIEPSEPELRWGAVADLVAVLGLSRQRGLAAAGTDVDGDFAWARIGALVTALATRRPVPGGGPSRLDVRGPDGALVVARRCSCCQWHRAARVLGEAVGDARCADCPSLEPSVNVTRLAALASSGGLGAP